MSPPSHPIFFRVLSNRAALARRWCVWLRRRTGSSGRLWRAAPAAGGGAAPAFALPGLARPPRPRRRQPLVRDPRYASSSHTVDARHSLPRPTDAAARPSALGTQFGAPAASTPFPPRRGRARVWWLWGARPTASARLPHPERLAQRVRRLFAPPSTRRTRALPAGRAAARSLARECRPARPPHLARCGRAPSD